MGGTATHGWGAENPGGNHHELRRRAPERGDRVAPDASIRAFGPGDGRLRSGLRPVEGPARAAGRPPGGVGRGRPGGWPAPAAALAAELDEAGRAIRFTEPGEGGRVRAELCDADGNVLRPISL